MFGLKWLWKTNRGSNIDTSNFVSKEFLNTTLQDYVNRDLLNTTLSNELANYVSTTTLNRTLNNYVLNSALNTTLSSYVQTNTLNTTLTNYLTTNTEQTITRVKTFRAAPVALRFKQADGRSDKQYVIFKANNDSTTFSLGSSIGETSFEANHGNIVFQTQQANKTIKFDTANVNLETASNVWFRRAVPEFGSEIKAGWGGVVCKFLPEDNSTKTLQFYLNNPNDTRKFNLLVPEPTQANNPATKNYVDNQLANQPSSVSVRYQDIAINNPTDAVEGQLRAYVFAIDTDQQDINFMSATINYQNQTNKTVLARTYAFTYAATNSPNTIQFRLAGYNNVINSLSLVPNWTQTTVRIFYTQGATTRSTNPFFLVEVDN